MKIQWEILLFIIIFNISIGVVIALQVPGAEYANPIPPSEDVDYYESHFNVTEAARGWTATPFSGVPVIGDIFAGFNFFWQLFGYMVDGMPTLLTWISDSFITSTSGQTAFAIIANALRAIYAVLVVTFIIEFISGRNITD